MPKHLTQTDLIQDVRDTFGMSHGTAESVVKHLIDLVADNLADGGQVTLKNFGAFKTRHRAGHAGRNPHSGEPIYVEPRTAVSFKAGRGLVARVNGG